MARPKKATVDYFPHVTEHGKTIFILEKKYGVYGYAAWFKILERLGQSDGHFIDCRDYTMWEYLAALAFVDTTMLGNIVDTLANLGAIDKDLWMHKVIFSQKFVDGVKEAYSQRKGLLPTRDAVLLLLNINQAGFVVPETPLDDTFGGRNRERERERERETLASEVLTLEANDQTKAFIPVETVDNSADLGISPVNDSVLRGLHPVDNSVVNPQTLEKRGEYEKPDNPPPSATILRLPVNAGIG